MVNATIAKLKRNIIGEDAANTKGAEKERLHSISTVKYITKVKMRNSKAGCKCTKWQTLLKAEPNPFIHFFSLSANFLNYYTSAAKPLHEFFSLNFPGEMPKCSLNKLVKC